MGMIQVGKQGNKFTLNGQIVEPREYIGIDGFKFVNHIVAWIDGLGGQHLDNARRYIAEEVVGNGCKKMRAPWELMFWGLPYFDRTDARNVANTMDLVNLRSGTGSNYEMTPKLKKVIRMFVVLAREADIVIEVPILWTIKGSAHGDGNEEIRARLGIPEGEADPRNRHTKAGDNGVTTWNEHFVGNEDDGIGVYLQKLKTEGDGEGEHRVDPGGLNLELEAANEVWVHSDRFAERQLRSIARRFQERDFPGELLQCSASAGPNQYDLPYGGVEGFASISVHTERSVTRYSDADVARLGLSKAEWDWDETGDLLRELYGNRLIVVNESQLWMTQAQRDEWVPKIPKWAGLGSTDLPKCQRMLENFLDNGIYCTAHTFRGMDGGWPWTRQTATEEALREVTRTSGGGGGTPPPPVDEEGLKGDLPYVRHAYLLVLGRDPWKSGDQEGAKAKAARIAQWRAREQKERDLEVAYLESIQTQNWATYNRLVEEYVALPRGLDPAELLHELAQDTEGKGKLA